jgi:hypothetical protein
MRSTSARQVFIIAGAGIMGLALSAALAGR